MNESELKRSVEDYLTYQMNLGKLYYDRLNSGSILARRGDKTYKVALCREGTADLYVLQKWHPRGAPNKWETRVIYLECKTERGKQRPEQGGFQNLVEAQGASYYIVRSLDDVIDIIE